MLSLKPLYTTFDLRSSTDRKCRWCLFVIWSKFKQCKLIICQLRDPMHSTVSHAIWRTAITEMILIWVWNAAIIVPWFMTSAPFIPITKPRKAMISDGTNIRVNNYQCQWSRSLLNGNSPLRLVSDKDYILNFFIEKQSFFDYLSSITFYFKCNVWKRRKGDLFEIKLPKTLYSLWRITALYFVRN